MKTVKTLLSFIFIIVFVWAAFYPNKSVSVFPVLKGYSSEIPFEANGRSEPLSVEEDGVYTTKDEVALYIHTFGRLPSNFVTKEIAAVSGWKGEGLETYLPGRSIGGNKFGNYADVLPPAPARTYWECDIETLGLDSRGSKRIVYSNDGLIYYTADHYETFVLLYGQEEE